MNTRSTRLKFGLAVCAPLMFMVARADTKDETAIKRILNEGCAAWIAGKAEQSVDLYLENVTVYDISPPRQKNHDQVVQFNKQLAEMTVGSPICVYEEIHPVMLTENFAYSTAIVHAAGKTKDGKTFDFHERSTDVWKKVHGKWRVMHEHNSVPVNVITGMADLESVP